MTDDANEIAADWREAADEINKWLNAALPSYAGSATGGIIAAARDMIDGETKAIERLAAALAERDAEIERQAAEIARLKAGEWRAIDDEARNGEPWLIQTARGRIFVAKMTFGVAVNEGGEDCAAWGAVDDDFYPPDWSDGLCWEFNADGEPSDPPVMYAPPPTDTPEDATVTTHDSMGD
jgi:hypothetical protein